jgi:hypothetical protein
MFAVLLKAHIVSYKEEALGENLLLVLRPSHTPLALPFCSAMKMSLAQQ